jgi:tellurite resistance protein
VVHGGRVVREVIIGVAGAIAFAASNAIFFHFTDGKNSFISFVFLAFIPIDWAMIGIYMGMVIGLTHKGIDASDKALLFVAGALAALLCTALTHFLQFLVLSKGYWDFNLFIRYFAVLGREWGLFDWYFGLSTVLATVIGGGMALVLSTVQRADNIRSALPKWVSPTTRILIHVARADGRVSENEVVLIWALLEAQVKTSLPRLPADFDTAIRDVFNEELEAINRGVTLQHDLKDKCFVSLAQRESVAKMAIAVAMADGEASEKEEKLLDEILAVWKFDLSRRGELAADAFAEFNRAIRP